MARTWPKISLLSLGVIGFLIFIIAVTFFNSPIRPIKSKKKLKVLAYSSFIAHWGPGPKLAEDFEHEFGVRIEFLPAEESGLLVNRLQAKDVDVVLGLDASTVVALNEEDDENDPNTKWREHGLQQNLFHDSHFAVFDWAPIGLVFRKDELPPEISLNDMLNEKLRSGISLQDPRSSSPGYQFFDWILSLEANGEFRANDFFKSLKPNVAAVTGSWSQSYGLLTRGVSKVTLSYATSPLYHHFVEKSDQYRFAKFKEGTPIQFEFAGVPGGCSACEEAVLFVRFLLSQKSQKTLMTKNWMLPVLKPSQEMGSFDNSDELPTFERLYSEYWDSARRESSRIEHLEAGHRKKVLAAWQSLD